MLVTTLFAIIMSVFSKTRVAPFLPLFNGFLKISQKYLTLLLRFYALLSNTLFIRIEDDI